MVSGVVNVFAGAGVWSRAVGLGILEQTPCNKMKYETVQYETADEMAICMQFITQVENFSKNIYPRINRKSFDNFEKIGETFDRRVIVDGVDSESSGINFHLG